jgi:hypothetical protein
LVEYILKSKKHEDDPQSVVVALEIKNGHIYNVTPTEREIALPYCHIAVMLLNHHQALSLQEVASSKIYGIQWNMAKIITFILLTVAGVLLLPDDFIFAFVKRFIPISGDGEYGMDNFEMNVLLIKTLVCALGTGAVITLFRAR